MSQAVGIFAVASDSRTPARLHIGGAPRVRAERPQHRRRVEGPRSHFHVVRLQDRAALRAPIVMKRQDQVLKAQGSRFSHGRGLWRMMPWLASRRPFAATEASYISN